MKKPNYMAGPWEASRDTVFAIDHGKRITIAQASCKELTQQGDEANARLIAAAPAMAEALINLMEAITHHDSFQPGRSYVGGDTFVDTALNQSREALTLAGYEF